ncbi:hypothetical protein SAMN05216420_101383 [Nitrosospira sp. Nl5]|uniref:hypothetical protein n=1 Tax=Nitrosospira sp. Nl5 TaxID=200120 RepID=UPI00088247F8|nr:hypothetical protein [Nitrosospira sp. Nl5]SCX93626.1 hypothetical protein SAMN05216420_101383 [Nitrosospira sp. Nl5]
MIEALVVNRLLRWAKWKMQTQVALGYPSQVSFVRLAPTTTHFRDPGIDAECVITEKAYELLPVLCKAVLWTEYLSTAISESHKAHLFGRSRRVYRECLTEAYVKIGNTLEWLHEKKREEVA